MKRLLLYVFCLCQASAFPQDLTVRVDRPGAAIPSTMWGIFFEDINMAADGGLYAELVKNRSFEFNAPLMGWKEHSAAAGDGSILVLNRGEENPANPRYIRISHFTDGAYGVSNEGFRGMGIKKDEVYHFSIWTRMHQGTGVSLRLELVAADGQKIATARLRPAGGGGWEKDTVSMVAGATEPKAQLYIW